MKRVRGLREEELELWRHVIRHVTPLKDRTPTDASAPEPSEKIEPKVPASAPQASEVIKPLPPAVPPLAPVERKLRQRVARGQMPIETSVDLHGMRQSEAHAALLRVIHRAQRDGIGLVLVVTGKGGDDSSRIGETGERGVLRRLVPHWLADPAIRQFVIGFEAAPRHHGGSGALYVRIRRARN